MDFKKNPKTTFKALTKLSQDEARREIRALREGIEYHDDLYYVKNRPAISDETYDRLFRRLQDLESAFPEFASPDSPTQRVGGKAASGLAPVRHTAPLLSLNSVYKEGEVDDFADLVRRETGVARPAFTAEPKFDGLSVEVVYEKGTFARGSTRGDGETGEDISRNIRTIKTVPLRLRGGGEVPSFLAVRGEIILHKADFQKLNKRRIQNGEEPFANPRNAAAGSVRQLDPRKAAAIPLDIFFYDVLEIRGAELSSQWDLLGHLPAWGLKTDRHNRKCSTLEEVKRYHALMAAERDTLSYEIDGVVVKLDDFGLRGKLGMRQRSPRWALAWKFPPKKEVTVLRDIVVQVGRTGVLTPVALLDPVNVGGVTVSRATLHNEDEVRRKDVRVGDRVRVERAGDVIPEVVERVAEKGRRRGKPFVMPRLCPSCGTRVVREGAFAVCPNGLACRSQLIGRVAHFASRGAMDIDGLGGNTVKELVDRKMIRSVADLYRLTAGDFKRIEGFADKSANQLVEAVARSKTARLERFLYALGIQGVGERAAQAVARRFGSLEAVERAGLEDFGRVEGIGPSIARSLFEFFREKENRTILGRLKAAGLVLEGPPARAGAGPLKGKTFVFTGELERFTRAEAERRVEDLGGRASSSVSRKTDFVVAGLDPGSKLEDARKLKVRIIDEKAFEKLLASKS
jgi:DNA ligase (NAD+)